MPAYRFLYSPDIHGSQPGYQAALRLAAAHQCRAIVVGGDMLPKGGGLFQEQTAFLSGFFPAFLDDCASMNIEFYGLFGNDDLASKRPLWTELVRTRPMVHDLADAWLPLPGDLWIRGCSFVPDYPFGLKDWTMRDRPGAPLSPQLGRAVISRDNAFTPIPELEAFYASRPTLEEHLETLVDPRVPMDRAIFVPHAPPSGISLATLWSGLDVGSRAVRDWIDRHQPLATFSGHIHESPDVAYASIGEYTTTARIGRTVCHQPGQALPSQLSYSLVDLTADPAGIHIHWARETLGRRPGRRTAGG